MTGKTTSRAPMAFGCFSLLFGIQIICGVHLLLELIVVMLASSTDAVTFLGTRISANRQLMWGTFCAIGVPLTITAGVGAVYRIPHLLRYYYTYLCFNFVLIPHPCRSPTRYYYTYLCFNFVLITFTAFGILIEGEICQAFVSDDIIRVGKQVVCGFADTFAIAWIFVIMSIAAYCIHIVLKAEQAILDSFMPEVAEFKRSLERSGFAQSQGGLSEKEAAQLASLKTRSQLLMNIPEESAEQIFEDLVRVKQTVGDLDVVEDILERQALKPPVEKY